MRTLLLDAGVWLAARDADDRFHTESRQLIGAGSFRLCALDLTLYEVANVATGRWESAAEANRLVKLVLKACGADLVRVDPELMQAATAAAAKASITVYDAAYIVAAGAREAELVSTDLRDLVRPGLARSPADALA